MRKQEEALRAITAPFREQMEEIRAFTAPRRNGPGAGPCRSGTVRSLDSLGTRVKEFFCLEGAEVVA
jgi:hypothetical protein